MPYKNPLVAKAYAKAYHKKYGHRYKDKERAKYRALTLDQRVARAERLYINKLLRSYNLTKTQYEDLLFKQSGLCAVCGLVMDRPVVDHNHTTGKVRGLLHGVCNSMLGMAKDSPEVLRRAADYLCIN
jgi:predicted nuclease of restriction endonuclease-like RecB superfamily